MSDNIFDIPDAPERRCQMYLYQRGHSHLNIVIYPTKQDKQRLIVFSEVRYIECPVTWSGAGFRRKSPEASFRFAHSIRFRPSKAGDYTLFEAHINRETPSNRLHVLSFKIYDIVTALLPSAVYRRPIVRVLARSASMRMSQEDIEQSPL